MTTGNLSGQGLHGNAIHPIGEVPQHDIADQQNGAAEEYQRFPHQKLVGVVVVVRVQVQVATIMSFGLFSAITRTEQIDVFHVVAIAMLIDCCSSSSCGRIVDGGRDSKGRPAITTTGRRMCEYSLGGRSHHAE